MAQMPMAQMKLAQTLDRDLAGTGTAIEPKPAPNRREPMAPVSFIVNLPCLSKPLTF